jgi:DNA-binding NarL/FixJ family response regulator
VAAIRIFFADDHEVVRSDVRSIFEAQEGWQVVDEQREPRILLFARA